MAALVIYSLGSVLLTATSINLVIHTYISLYLRENLLDTPQPLTLADSWSSLRASLRDSDASSNTWRGPLYPLNLWVFSLLGMVYSPFCFALHLMTIVWKRCAFCGRKFFC